MIALALALAITAAPAPQPLAGDWVVDLTPGGGKPYLKGMSLSLAQDGTVSGSFYDSTIEAGRWKTSKGRTCVSFRTTDGEGPYHTAACIQDGSVTGQTWAEHRRFVFIWSARKATAEDVKAEWW